jgi:hypothetical protein
LMDNTCKNPLNNPYIRLTGNNQIEQLNSGYRGLSQTFCFECSARGDIISANGLTLSQTSACSTSMRTTSVQGTFTYLYGQGLTTVVNGR